MLVSALHRHASQMTPPSWTSLLSPTLSHPSMLSQSIGLSSLCHKENSYYIKFQSLKWETSATYREQKKTRSSGYFFFFLNWSIVDLPLCIFNTWRSNYTWLFSETSPLEQEAFPHWNFFFLKFIQSCKGPWTDVRLLSLILGTWEKLIKQDTLLTRWIWPKQCIFFLKHSKT